jgi:hypothetical protein
VRPTLVLVSAFAWLAACQAPSSPVPEARADETPAAPAAAGGVAVVELFTSEGCSSCPPADDVARELAARPDAESHVYVLAFHVDYWDELGWKDRFASPELTERQHAYARAFGTRGMYTPQMIVSGATQFTGSDRESAHAAIRQALAVPASIGLMLHTRRTATGVLAVDWTATSVPTNAALNVALVERAATSVVASGENAGRTLRHADVVRSFVTVPFVQPSGTTSVAWPSSLRKGEGEVIVFAQRSAGGGGGMPVLGATSGPLPE